MASLRCLASYVNVSEIPGTLVACSTVTLELDDEEIHVFHSIPNFAALHLVSMEFMHRQEVIKGSRCRPALRSPVCPVSGYLANTWSRQLERVAKAKICHEERIDHTWSFCRGRLRRLDVLLSHVPHTPFKLRHEF